MKKLYQYLILFIIVMLAFTLKVNAALKCNKAITITETSTASPAKFQATLSVCDNPIFDHYNTINSGSHYPEVKAYAYEEVGTVLKSTDNKSYYHTTVPRCDDKNTMVSAVMEYKSYFKGSYTYGTKCNYIDICSGQSYSGCNSSYCTWIEYPQSDDGGGGSSDDGGSGDNGGGGGGPYYGCGRRYCVNVEENMSAKMSSDTIAQSDGYCSRDRYYCQEVTDYDNIVGYTCPSGSTKFAPAKVMERQCVKSYTRKTGYECITNNYHYDGSIGHCKIGGNDSFTIDRNSEVMLQRYMGDCKSFGISNSAVDDKYSIWCEPVGITYYLYCPVYRCTNVDKTFHTCTPSFSVGKTRAYCVNPSDKFAPNGGTSASYQVDETFKATECTSSYNTIDCGHANILIEGNYNNLNEKAIELAMRLWQVHTGQSGFKGVGLSLKTGTTCGTNTWFMQKNNRFYNVYTQTYNYAIRNFFANAHDFFVNGYLNPKTKSSKFGITCSAIKSNKIVNMSKYAVACGSYNEYKQAIALLFNTILGNKKMQDHLVELYKGHTPHDPVYATFTEDYSSQKHYVYVRFEEEQFNQIFEDYKIKEVNCSKLKKTDKYYDEIAPYCQVRTILYNANGKIIDEGHMSECVKNIGCYRETKLEGFLVCTTHEKTKVPVRIKTQYTLSRLSGSVSKYISCAGKNNQLLYAFNKLSTDYNEKIDINKISKTELGEKTFEVSGFACNKDYCNETGVKEIGSKSCKSDLKYNGSFNYEIKDPSLKCIARMRNKTIQARYDYSDYFHVNTDLCRIYCSDEVKYTIADKVKEKSARNFMFDIKPSDSKLNAVQPLVATIKEKRTCVSKINYNDIVDNIESIRLRYDLTEKELPSTVKGNPPAGIEPIKSGNTIYRPAGINDLINALLTKARKENNRGENINQVLYDLYNCNLYSSNNNNFGSVGNSDVANSVDSSGKAKNNIIEKPKDNLTGNVRSYINKMYAPTNAYGIDRSNCALEVNNKGVITKNECIVHNPIEYNFGADRDGKKAQIKSISRASSSVSSIKYCSGKGCFDYNNKENETQKYKYGNGNIKNKYTPKTFNLRNISFSTINVPTNDYAYFDIEFEVGFYNSSRYEVEPNTGKVYYMNDRTNYLVNKEYSFPTSNTAYNTCNMMYYSGGGKKDSKQTIKASGISTNEVNKFNEEFRRCKIDQKFEPIATFHRVFSSDDFVKKVKESTNFSCYVDVKVPTPYTKIYRNVDPEDLFPDENNIGVNWLTKEGKSATIQIETTAEELRENEEMIDYSIILTPEQIKELKEYNKTKGSSNYRDEQLIYETCTLVPDKYDESGNLIERGYYINCESKFMSELRKNKNGKLATVSKSTYGKIKK